MATSKAAYKYTGITSLFEQTNTTVFSSKTGDQVGTTNVTKSGYYPVCMAGYSLSANGRVHRIRLASPADGSVTIEYSIMMHSSGNLNVFINWMKIT